MYRIYNDFNELIDTFITAEQAYFFMREYITNFILDSWTAIQFRDELARKYCLDSNDFGVYGYIWAEKCDPNTTSVNKWKGEHNE